MLNYSKTADYHYSVDCDYDGSYDCSSYGCDSEGICRCFEIYQAWVNHNLVTYWGLFKKLNDSKNSNLTSALNFLFLLRTVSVNDFHVYYSSGYYGDEIDSVTLNLDEDEVHTFNSLTDLEKLRFVLTKEYGFLLSKIKNYNKISLECLDLEKIISPPNTKLDEKTVKFYRKTAYPKLDPWFPPIIVIKDENHYKLIDGRHKLKSVIDNDFKDTVHGIVLAK